MKTPSTSLALALGLWASSTAAHATFQSLWVDGTDFDLGCARVPLGNSPVTNVAGDEFVCNSNNGPASGKCPITAGGAVTIEMHQQPGDRACGNEPIGGAHYGPVSVYLQAVEDSATAAGPGGGWFKIFEDGWKKNPSGAVGDDDFWGTKDLNTCCGRMEVPIPDDLADGDYLLRAEALALHTAGQANGAQFYMTCYQVTISGGTGTASPETVNLPGAVSASDPGVLINIHAALDTYISPGPAVYSSGSIKEAGSACTGCSDTCVNGEGPFGEVVPASTSGAATDGSSEEESSSSGGCSVAQYQQCGGAGWTGCTECSSGTCTQLNEYFYQCQ